MALRACRESLPVLAAEFFPPAASHPSAKFRRLHPFQYRIKKFSPPAATEELLSSTAYRNHLLLHCLHLVFRYQKDPSEPCLGTFIATEFLIPAPYFFVFFLAFYTECIEMIGAVSVCHYSYQNARRSKFPTWNETAGVQVLCACAVPLSSLSLCLSLSLT
jgi:hypothetical protein